jgi:hypothetical protein
MSSSESCQNAENEHSLAVTINFSAAVTIVAMSGEALLQGTIVHSGKCFPEPFLKNSSHLEMLCAGGPGCSSELAVFYGMQPRKWLGMASLPLGKVILSSA